MGTRQVAAPRSRGRGRRRRRRRRRRRSSSSRGGGGKCTLEGASAGRRRLGSRSRPRASRRSSSGGGRGGGRGGSCGSFPPAVAAVLLGTGLRGRLRARLWSLSMCLSRATCRGITRPCGTIVRDAVAAGAVGCCRRCWRGTICARISWQTPDRLSQSSTSAVSLLLVRRAPGPVTVLVAPFSNSSCASHARARG